MSNDNTSSSVRLQDNQGHISAPWFARHTPTELVLGSMLVGGGAYGATRLLQDLAALPKKNEKDQTILEVAVPKGRRRIGLPEEEQEPSAQELAANVLAFTNQQKAAAELIDTVSTNSFKAKPEAGVPATTQSGTADTRMTPTELVSKVLGVAGGGVAGYFGASKLYEYLREKQEKDKLEQKRQKLLEVLQKTSEEVTPILDSLVLGMASAFEKEASWYNPDWIHKTRPDLKHDVVPALTAIPGQLGSAAIGLTEKLHEGVKDTPLYDWGTAAALSALALGGGSAYIAARLDAERKLKEKNRREMVDQVTIRYV